MSANVKSMFSRDKMSSFLKSKKAKVVGIVSAAVIMALPVTASAAETGGTNITYWTVTDDLISPLYNSINSNLNAAVPYGFAIMGSFLGLNIFKRAIYTFF